MIKFYLTLVFFLLFSELFAQWELKTNGLPAEWSVADPMAISDDSTIAAFFRISQFPRPISISHDLANSWTNYNTTNPWDGNDISVLDKNTIWFCTAEGNIYHSSDGGLSWIKQFEDTVSPPCLDFIKFFDKDNGIVVGSASSRTSPTIILKTTDGGSNWINVNASSLIGEVSFDIFFYIDFPSISVGYFAGSKAGRNYNKLYKTINGGISWTEISRPAGVQRVCVIKFYDEKLGMLVEDIYSQEDYVYKTTDGGNSWTKSSLPTNPGLHDIEFIPGKPSNVWMTDFEKLYFSSDTGTTWQEVYVTDQSLTARNIEFLNDSTGFISCDDGYFWATFNKGGVVTSLDRQNEYVPRIFTLQQNYPNPFSARGGSGSDGNPATTIEYTIPGRSTEYYSVQQNVVLKVYDILGTELATLVNRQQAPGSYEVEFDGSNLPSGLYIYRLISGDLTSVRKMLLIK